MLLLPTTMLPTLCLWIPEPKQNMQTSRMTKFMKVLMKFMMHMVCKFSQTVSSGLSETEQGVVAKDAPVS